MKFKTLFEKLKYKSFQKDLKDFLSSRFRNVSPEDTKIGKAIFNYYLKNMGKINLLKNYQEWLVQFLSDVEKNNIYPLIYTILGETYQIDSYEEFIEFIKYHDSDKFIDKFLNILKTIYRNYTSNKEDFIKYYKNRKINKSNIPIKHKNLWG